VWDDWGILRWSVNNISRHCEKIIIVWSHKSNFGEASDRPDLDYNEENKITFINFEPDLKNSPRDNETLKRNIGLNWAKKTDCTHFLMMDADEFYTNEDILKAKEEIGNNEGLVCRSKVYFKKPTLTIGFDTTLVTFIHKLTPEIQFGMNHNYPFAWSLLDGIPFTHTKKIRIDPTRQILNINPHNIKWSEAIMHHYSWVRRDVKKKIRNSTARPNIERSTILQDYMQADEGYFCQFYGKTLEACSNIFNLPETIDLNVKETY